MTMPVLCQEQTAAMFPSTRPSPTNAYNMGHFGSYMGGAQYHTQTPDYSQFNVDHTGYQNCYNMYNTAATRPQTMDDWTSYSTHGMTAQMPASTTPPSHYSYKPTHGIGLADYAQHTHSNLTVLESPPQPHGASPVSSTSSGSSLSPTNKQLRPAYEWMKPNTLTTTGPSQGKTRTKDKYRVVYSDHQRLELEKEFHYSRYITIRRKAELAQALILSERQVKIWFQNRRAKERKQNKKRGGDETGNSDPSDLSGENGSLPLIHNSDMSVQQHIKQDPSDEFSTNCHIQESSVSCLPHSSSSHYHQQLSSPQSHVTSGGHSPGHMTSIKMDPHELASPIV